MKKLIAGALGAPWLFIAATGLAQADGGGGLFGALFGGDKSTFPPVTAGYRDECGSCHLAFPPGLLSADAWVGVMTSLKNHFGDDVSLSPAVAKELRGYLTANAGKGSSRPGPRSDGAKAKPTDEPPRITDTVYFKERHAEISARFVKANSKIGSYANCQACHLDADQGSFSEDKIKIPGAVQAEDR